NAVIHYHRTTIYVTRHQNERKIVVLHAHACRYVDTGFKINDSRNIDRNKAAKSSCQCCMS
ncbi:MAG: hypothetical protein KME67_16580, partial [Candidatus Thiodiazotropha sp. (ex Codakia orbicularis)]|nr:hypothetical protein [Candidatus Thiodiazotropha sp. (ex Codakia orbicularis)]